MTWNEMITVAAEPSLDKKQVIAMFYQMGAPDPGKDLADIALLCGHDDGNSFCIRLTWQGDIPERGKSTFGSRLAEVLSEKGHTHHTLWRRETSLFLINGR